MHTIISENTMVNAAPNAPARSMANTVSITIIEHTSRNRNIVEIPFSYVFLRSIKDHEIIAKRK